MSKYDIFAQYYDLLTSNVDYAGRAEYLMELFRRLHHPAGITLDLACGTGSLTLELSKRGVDVYGLDASPSMLAVASEKCFENQLSILFLCQKMQCLDLYGTVDTVVCALDSLNHLADIQQIEQTFKKVHLFLNPEGLFVFDMNTVFKHREILKDNVFIYDMEDIFCVWQNRLRPQSDQVDITLDFFEKSGKLYERSREHFAEVAFPSDRIVKALQNAGFSDIAVYDDMSFAPPKLDSQRLVYVARKSV